MKNKYFITTLAKKGYIDPYPPDYFDYSFQWLNVCQFVIYKTELFPAKGGHHFRFL
jgi:hypothetical protein